MKAKKQISWAGSVKKQNDAVVAELSVSDLSASAKYYVEGWASSGFARALLLWKWYASHYGCSRSEMRLDCSVCVHVAAARMPIVMGDAKRDRRWQNHPAITDDFRFYAGVPLFSWQRVPIGAMCIVDTKPKRFTASNMRALSSMAVMADCMLEKMRLYAQIEKCCP
jgi:GAF domain-containing protein